MKMGLKRIKSWVEHFKQAKLIQNDSSLSWTWLHYTVKHAQPNSAGVLESVCKLINCSSHPLLWNVENMKL